MLTRCIFCHNSFNANDRFEHLPLGRRIAFDPARGRLWCICEFCQSWTLMPIEQRWEALEELERATRGPAKLLRQGENIALFKLGPLDLVRIGRARFREEAWWRYGSELTRRQENARKIVRKGKWFDAAIWLAITGVPIWAFSNAEEWIDKARHKSFGRYAWRGAAACERCGHMVSAVGFRDRRHVEIVAGDQVSLRMPCPKCVVDGRRLAQSGPLIHGAEAVHTLRRVLAFQNFAGAPQADIDRASSLVQEPHAIAALAARLTNGNPVLDALDSTGALTLEIALNDRHERALLDLEVYELDARWREEEKIAAIVDGELTRLRGSGIKDQGSRIQRE